MWGVIGGLGPRASAEFLRTIYDLATGTEQDAPAVILVSDPSFPDRTDLLLKGCEVELLKQLCDVLEKVSVFGVTRIVICCVTIHHLLPKLPIYFRSRIVSLLDVIFAAVQHDDRRHLLLCTRGSRQLGLFTNHPLWEEVRDQIVLLTDEEQETIHKLIYRLKNGGDSVDAIQPLTELARQYEIQSIIAGCTEGHIIARRGSAVQGLPTLDWIDPLTIVAKEMVSRQRHGTR